MAGFVGPQRDASYTLLQPIKRSAASAGGLPGHPIKRSAASAGGLPGPLRMLTSAVVGFHDCIQPKYRDRRPPNVRKEHPLSSLPSAGSSSGCSGGLCLGLCTRTHMHLNPRPTPS